MSEVATRASRSRRRRLHRRLRALVAFTGGAAALLILTTGVPTLALFSSDATAQYTTFRAALGSQLLHVNPTAVNLGCIPEQTQLAETILFVSDGDPLLPLHVALTGTIADYVRLSLSGQSVVAAINTPKLKDDEGQGDDAHKEDKQGHNDSPAVFYGEITVGLGNYASVNVPITMSVCVVEKEHDLKDNVLMDKSNLSDGSKIKPTTKGDGSSTVGGATYGK